MHAQGVILTIHALLIKTHVMKKFLLGSIAFFLFSISISILQTSCDKEVDASPEVITEVTQLNKVFYLKHPEDKFPGEIWSANYDGSGQTKINILMPSGYEIGSDGGPHLSPDGKRLFFTASRISTYESYIFSCNLDGSDVKFVLEMQKGNFTSPNFGGAY